MTFTQPVFVGFLALVFALYWLPLTSRGGHKLPVLLLASYIFYGWWDWRFTGLLLFCSLVAYSGGIAIRNSASTRARKFGLTISIVLVLGVLVAFKYHDFFVHGLVEAFAGIGIFLHPGTFDLVLPVGISFYTFQAIGYVHDVYRGEVQACDRPITFLTFQAFFPHVLAGPIARAGHLIPQLEARRPFSYSNAVKGCRLILLGAFKKLVVADRLAPLVDTIHGDQSTFSGVFNILGAVLFSLQIYCDFSGYTDMARGVAKLFNLDLAMNFNRPYMARSLREFWSRWHISLNTWLRDHLYIPLGGKRGTWGERAVTLMITFMLSGLWHGANWTFVCWGTMHGAFLLLERMARGGLERLPTSVRWGITMSVILLGRILFRSEDIGHAWVYIARIVDHGKDLSAQFAHLLGANGLSRTALLATIMLTALFLLVERLTAVPSIVRWFDEHALARRASYGAALAAILLFGAFTDRAEFIYFKF